MAVRRRISRFSKGYYLVKILKKNDSLTGRKLVAYCDGTIHFPWQVQNTNNIYTIREIEVIKQARSVITG